LKRLDSSDISAGCTGYIAILDACRSDIDTHCSGKEYTSDAIVCLTEWTKGVTLSEACSAALPKKEESKKQREADKIGSDAKKKAEQRRKYFYYF
jgi:hypothetical protein